MKLAAAVAVAFLLQDQSSQHKYKGVSFTVPKNWKVNPTDEGTALVPEGSNPSGVLEEAYLLVSDPALKSIDGAKFEETINAFVEQIQPGAARQGSIEKKKFGQLEGRVIKYKAQTEDGKTAEIRLYAFMGESFACALCALGYPDVLSKRDKDVESILASLSKGEAAKDAPKNAKKIDGGTTHRFKGISFDLPQAWKVTPTDEGTALVPEGSNPNGVLEEAYVLVNDPKLKAVDGQDFENAISQLVEKLQPGLKLDGGFQKKSFGDLDGRVARYKGTAGGKSVEVRVHAFMSSQGAAALVVLGYTDAISKRDANVDAILGSMFKSAAQGGAREELAGSWCHMTNVNANDGGRRSDSTLTLAADGTYKWRAESNWSGPAGFGFTAQYEEGTWSATDDSLTLKPQNGEAKTFGLEKRNHPKNKSDPMIVLDGQCFVTVYKKAPWE